jgi:hypothetical protein
MRSYSKLALSFPLKRFVKLPFVELGKNPPASIPKVEFLTEVEPPAI